MHARGVFALLAQGASEDDTRRALAAALVAGNSVALVSAAAGEALKASFVAAGVAAEAIALLPADAAVALLAEADIAGVCVLAPGAPAARSAARLLATRRGAILPLIARAEALRPDRLWRFCAEQTLTINTAAAGGNAELLAAAGRDLDGHARAA